MRLWPKCQDHLNNEVIEALSMILLDKHQDNNSFVSIKYKLTAKIINQSSSV